MPSFTIRSTRTTDKPAVVEVVRAAFTGEGRDGHEEVDIVQRTWAIGAHAKAIDLVAIGGGEIIGHVLAAPGTLGETQLLAVAPLGVAPAHQGRGVGSRLMESMLRQADGAGWPAVVLLGDPQYYSRFGFEHAGKVGVVYAAVGSESPHFQLRRLHSYDPSLHGSFVYCWEVGH